MVFGLGSLPQLHLVAITPAFPQRASPNPLLENLHNLRRIASLWFANQRVHMFGHNDESDDKKPKSAAHLAEPAAVAAGAVLKKRQRKHPPEVVLFPKRACDGSNSQ
ncbi:MAG TPA: hypothetical protein VFQ00_13910 [Terriglobales bacterium]|nr:hypothetical protein [Terriglobales bacterium]